MDLLTELLSMSNIILCLAIVAIVWVQRKGAEIFANKWFKKDLTKSQVWEEFLVPIGPLSTGAIIALIPFCPVPGVFAAGIGSKIVFGIGLGLMSGLVFRLTKKNLLDKIDKFDTKTQV